MIPIKNSAELAAMRKAGSLTAKICSALLKAAVPGTVTAELDVYAAELIQKAGGRSAFYGFHGFPGHICISVNEEVVHGVPGRRILQKGDLVSIDIGMELDGFFADMAYTIILDPAQPETIRLVETAKKALEQAVAHAEAGKRLSDISHAVETCAEASGYSVVRDFVGHGIGRQMHEEPQVPNFGPAGRGPKLKPGMTLAIEPMINMGTHEIEILNDGWTVVTKDRRPSAHFEHTVAVRPQGPAEILTVER